MHFYHENHKRAQCCDQVGDDQGHVGCERSLHDEEDAAEAHHAECRKGDAFCVACADCRYGLWQVAEDHAYACCISYDGGEEFHVLWFV